MARKLTSMVAMLVGLLFVQACVRDMPAEDSCHFVQNSGGQRVSWKKNETVRLYLHESVPEEYWSSINAAVQSWNASLGSERILLEPGATGPLRPDRDGYSVIYLMDEWEEAKPMEQARTTVYWSGSYIYEADIRINEKNFNFSVEDQLAAGRVHLESLMIHEIGHVLGLAHNDADGSVMNERLSSATMRNVIKSADLNSVSCEYL